MIPQERVLVQALKSLLPSGGRDWLWPDDRTKYFLFDCEMKELVEVPEWRGWKP